MNMLRTAMDTQILTDKGWEPIDLDTLAKTKVHLFPQMLLTRELAQALTPYLQRFVNTGSITP